MLKEAFEISKATKKTQAKIRATLTYQHPHKEKIIRQTLFQEKASPLFSRSVSKRCRETPAHLKRRRRIVRPVTNSNYF